MKPNPSPSRSFHASERRRKPRICASFPVTVRGIDEAGEAFELKSRVENISASGLYMTMARRVAAGTVLFVAVTFAQPPAELADSSGVVAHGNVVRSEINPDGTFGVALHFTSYRPL